MSEAEAIAKRDEDPRNEKLVFLIDMYRPSFYMWEVVETLRRYTIFGEVLSTRNLIYTPSHRLAFTGALLMFGSGSVVQLFLGIWLAIGMVVATSLPDLLFDIKILVWPLLRSWKSSLFYSAVYCSRSLNLQTHLQFRYF